MARCWPLGVVVLALAGCTVALGYDGVDETSARRCTDGIDNDLDGEVDCEDASCNGHCPEDAQASCGDGADQDGDGLTDFADPGCWPYARVEVSSCASSPGADVTIDFDAPSERWAADDGAITNDPTGTFPGRSFVLGTAEESAVATYDVAVAGAVTGLRATADIALDPATAELYVTLVVDDAPTDFNKLEAHLYFGGGSPQLQPKVYWSPSASYGDPVPWSGGRGPYRLELTADATRLFVRLFQGATMVAETERDLVQSDRRAVGWGRERTPAHRFGLSLRARHDAGSAPVVVGAMSVHLDPVMPCGFASPASGAVSGSDGSFLNAGTRQGGVTCLFGNTYTDSDADPRTNTVWLVRSDDGRTFSGSSVRFDPRGDGFPRAYAVRPGRSGFELLLGRPDYVTGISADCAHVTDVTDMGRTDITFDGNGRPLGWSSRGGLSRIPWLTGPDGAPHHFWLEEIPSDGGPHEVFDLGDVPSALGEIHAAVVGDDVVLSWQAGLATIALPPRTSETARPIAMLGASGLTGACDEAGMEAPVLVMDESPALDDADVAATGTLYSVCRRDPLGIAQSRLVVRTPR